MYDRERLERSVGRQFGEPGDEFPDAASESNFAYRVGLSLCAAVLRVAPDCEGMVCNDRLFRHIGAGRAT